MSGGASLGQVSVALNVPDTVPVRRTVVTFGLERGGTSPVAGVQRALGISLGEITEKNNEDYRFHEKSVEELRAVVALRNTECDRWGFKYPRAQKFLPLIEHELRRPYYIVVHRDPVATALSRARWDGEETERPEAMALHEASVLDRENLTFALATERPCLLVSHAAASTNPDALIDEVADFVGRDRPGPEFRGRIRDYIAPGSYKPFEEFFPELVTA